LIGHTPIKSTIATPRRPRMHTWPGGHDGDYWDAHWRDHLRSYARARKRC
jgi:hypothetical protein